MDDRRIIDHTTSHSNPRHEVRVDPAKRVGDNSEAFFIGFSFGGGIEYLMIEKNGEKEPLEGYYAVPNRHGIEYFELFRENARWFFIPRMKKRKVVLC